MDEIKKPDPRIKNLLAPLTAQHGAEYVPSQFALPFVHRGKSYVFHTLTKQCLAAELPDICRAGEGYDPLIESRFLVSKDVDECGLYQKLYSMFRAYYSKKGVRGFTILPTFGCNARCIYCYEEGVIPAVMTRETEEQTVRFIQENKPPEGPVHVGWYGGEPLLGVGTIDRILEALRNAGVEYTTSMISNGSLITPEIIEKMAGPWNLKRIQISMDGAEADYRRRKNYYAYRDEYHAVMEAVSHLSEAGIRVSIRCNVDEENWPGVPRFLDDLKAGIKHKENVFLYFSLLYQLRCREEELALQEKTVAAQSAIRAAGFKTTQSPEVSLNFRTAFCMAEGGSVVIAPDGSLYPCEHCPPESRFGDVWNGVTNEQARVDFCRTDRIREKCRKCVFLPDCTGFENCPVKDYHCREIRRVIAVNKLRQLVEKKEGEAEAEEPSSC